MKRKPILGETLFELNAGNSTGGGREPKMTPVVVKSIGRKYFTCSTLEGSYQREVIYHIEDWRQKTEYFRNLKLYETAQEWEDERETNSIHKELRDEFNKYSPCLVPLETLRAIKTLLRNSKLK